MTELRGMITGFKIAAFTLVLIYAYLAHLRMDKFNFTWLGVTGGSFIAISLSEFLIALAQNSGATVFAWIVDLQNKVLFSDALFLIAGLGMLMFLKSVKQEEN